MKKTNFKTADQKVKTKGRINPLHCTRTYSDSSTCQYVTYYMTDMTRHVERQHMQKPCRAAARGCTAGLFPDYLAEEFHFKANHQIDFRCNCCKRYRASSRQAFEEHIEKCVDMEGPLPCTEETCTYVALNVDALWIHLQKVHGATVPEAEIPRKLYDAVQARPVQPQPEAASSSPEVPPSPPPTTIISQPVFFAQPPSGMQVVQRPGIWILYNLDAKQPVIVHQTLTKENLPSAALPLDSNNQFHYDPLLGAEVQLTTSEYNNQTTYQRGHYAARRFNRQTQDAFDACNMYSNISPQLKTLNTGLWHETERTTERFLKKYDRTEVTCGPIFTTNTVMGALRIPDYFWKIVSGFKEGGEKVTQVAWIIPHDVPSPATLEDFEVRLEQLEERTRFYLAQHHQ